MSNEFNHQQQHYRRRTHTHTQARMPMAQMGTVYFTICITHKMSIVEAFRSLCWFQHGMFSLTYREYRCTNLHTSHANSRQTHTHTLIHVNIHIQKFLC